MTTRFKQSLIFAHDHASTLASGTILAIALANLMLNLPENAFWVGLAIAFYFTGVLIERNRIAPARQTD